MRRAKDLFGDRFAAAVPASPSFDLPSFSPSVATAIAAQKAAQETKRKAKPFAGVAKVYKKEKALTTRRARLRPRSGPSRTSRSESARGRSTPLSVEQLVAVGILCHARVVWGLAVVLENRHFSFGTGFHLIELDFVVLDSATLSHLFAQGSVAAETFIADEVFRTKLNDQLPAGIKLRDPAARPNAGDYRIVYAIVTTKDLPHALPFFSKGH